MTIYPSGPQEGIPYVVTAPDGSRAVINDDTDPDYVGMGWITGLDDAEVRESVEPRSGTDGGVQGLNFKGTRPMTMNVQFGAPDSPTTRNQRWQKLRRACNVLRRDGTIDFTPDGGLPSRVYFRKNAPLRKADERGYAHTAQVGFNAADPYIYSQSEHASTDTGGGGASQTITNQGDGRSAPRIDITLTAASDVQITNITTGETVLLNNADPASIISYVSKFGTIGTGNSNLSSPSGVGLDGSGNVYVADTNNNRVKKFNSSGAFVANIGTQWTKANGHSNTATADGQIRQPTDVAVDGSGNIYVLHYGGANGTGRIDKFNSAGVYQAKSSTTFSDGIGGIAVDATPNVFAVDTKNDRVRKFATGLGAQTTSFGTSGTGDGQFTDPRGIAIDSTNRPLVVDGGTAKRVQRFTNAATPVYQAKWTMDGADGANWGSNPFGIAIDSGDNFYVSDVATMAIAKFNSSGVYQTKFGTFGSSDGQFAIPLYLDARGTTLWVPDAWNHRMQQFSAVTSSGIVTVDLSRGAVTTSTGVNLFQYVNVPLSQWWALDPGDNEIQVSGPGVSAWTITWRDAWG